MKKFGWGCRGDRAPGGGIECEGVPAKVFRAEHIIAIASSVGRQKDKARIEQLLQQAAFDKTRLEDILQRHKLKLPTL